MVAIAAQNDEMEILAAREAYQQQTLGLRGHSYHTAGAPRHHGVLNQKRTKISQQ